MTGLLPRSVRGRLWAALGLLSLAIVCISLLTWIALNRVDGTLQDLHQQSLTQVAQAIDLSKRSSDLATSAPYLLNQRSNVLIEQEGRKLLDVLDRVRTEWPRSDTRAADREAVVTLTTEMESGITDLVAASQALDRVQSLVRERVAALSTLREEVTARIEGPVQQTGEAFTWWTLQSMNADALNAAYADNLIGVGEEQRHYQRQRGLAENAPQTPAQLAYLQRLEDLVHGPHGVFELRREELGLILNAQNALFRIRRDANLINELAADVARRAEATLIAERSSSSRTIQFTRVSVGGISLAALALALAAALFVSRYVAFNIGRVSDAMVRLAQGDRSSALPRSLGGADEIDDLFRSFRAFRANALRLDRSNRQLDQRNALFEKVFANITDGIAITDNTGKLTASNPAFARILSVEQVKGSLVEWLQASAFGAAAKAADLTVQHRGHLVLTGEDGRIMEIRASRLPDEGRVWLLADVTEQRKIAERMEQIDRIELLGKLAGDTAHDFASILSTIRTHAHLLDTKSPDHTGNLSAINNAVDFGASLTDRLLAFARKQPLSPEVFDLNTLVEGMSELIEIGLKPGVTLKIAPAAAPLLVKADPGQLESAIFNLVLNSNSAIETEGTIRISLSQTDEGHAEVAVADDGAGMPASIRSKAIEPFFTTRAGSGGTGLGLSIVYGFINQSGGRMEIDSIEGNGTTVSFSLPLASDQSAAGKHSGLALVIDDNDGDRAASAAALADLGFKPLTVATAEDGINALGSQTFQVVLSDFDLGGITDGLQVLKRARHAQPDATCILISGKKLSASMSKQRFQVIEKPVSTAALTSALGAMREHA